ELAEQCLGTVAGEQELFVADLASDGYALIQTLLSACIFAAKRRGGASAVECTRTYFRSSFGAGHAESAFEPFLRFDPAVVQQPGPPQCADQAERDVGLACLQGPAQGRADIVMLALSPAQPIALVWTAKRVVRHLGSRQDPLRQAASHHRLLLPNALI